MNWVNQNPQDGVCIITGCDHHHEWMLPWWYAHYNKHNHYPIVIADFGMSDRGRQWCEGKSTIIPITQTYTKNWFKKPQALLHSTHKTAFWIDLDCEIRQSLGPLLTYAHQGLAVTLDPHNPHCKNPGAIASGVVGATHGNPLVTKWADDCQARQHDLRGDQEVLNAIIAADRTGIVIMPAEYQWLRLDGDNHNAIIMHWTGQAGKNLIKRQMKGLDKQTIPTKPTRQPVRSLIIKSIPAVVQPRKTTRVNHQNRPATIIAKYKIPTKPVNSR